jgi:hypothetical protein
MTDQGNQGGYFSRNYVAKVENKTDDNRMRLRIATYLSEYFQGESFEVGRYIEKELGQKVLRQGHTLFVDWEKTLTSIPIDDFLDILTAVCKFLPRRTITRAGDRITYDPARFFARVFREQTVPFRIDEKGGIHPFIDVQFSAQLNNTISGMGGPKLSAARESVMDAEKSLLEINFKGKSAIRSIFDANENIFKQIFPKNNQLNSAAIQNDLRPRILESHGLDNTEKKSTSKLIDSYRSWVDAAHFYRHDAGESEIVEPSHAYAVQFVSQGISYCRWLARLVK